MCRVIGIGDNVCDKYINQGRMFPGGQAMNFAVYCNKLGMKAAYIGVFGSDRVAAHNITVMKELGIDITRCRQIDGENGFALVDVIAGERSFIGSNKGGVLRKHPIELNPADLEYLSGFDWIHTSNNSYFDAQLYKLKDLNVPVSYDFSTSYTDEDRIHNVAPFVAKCIESIGNQEYQNLEIILIDDGSTDNSGEICDVFAKKDNRIRVIHKRNAGVSAARNTGIEACTRDDICFVDGDDYVIPDYVRKLFLLQ